MNKAGSVEEMTSINGEAMGVTGSQQMVSVWIVAYNHERFIRQCLESVMMQKTDFTFEVIVGEDCSTDGTRSIIEEFECKYPDIIKPIYHAKNVGAYRNAYEFCYPKLSGKYIACLEADDYWIDDTKLQTQVEALEQDSSAVMCFTQVKVLIDKDKRFEDHWSVAHNKKARYNLSDILEKFNIVTCTILFRNIYPELPYQPSNYPTGDVSLSVFLLLKGDAIFLDKVTAVYRVHDSGIFSPANLEKKNLVFVDIFREFLKEPLLAKYQSLLRVLFSDRAYQAYCFEIKKDKPEPAKADGYYKMAVDEFGLSNIYFPVKSFFRKKLFDLTGKGFGRKL